MAAISSGDVAFCQDPTSSSCVQLSPAAGPLPESPVTTDDPVVALSLENAPTHLQKRANWLT